MLVIQFASDAFRVGNFLFGQTVSGDDEADFHLGLGDAYNGTMIEKIPAIYTIAQQLNVPVRSVNQIILGKRSN